ncbi:hypothetical protein SSABA_v1c04920 [Spiroplasma sabaudiense Ar-1343]|uniref:Uncharacterized protein n=1 Tax=Spiroplasma sabaudiense Ar-1343 TaxID=1276257 RepID=W6AJK0_9MOLU|nr:hypothetical protein [Spiroplasma sabaudiense]AHI53899.1 hypothetical protein SSABA_v1c04920 [Spiroplasma sabaudiense Ar-1343]
MNITTFADEFHNLKVIKNSLDNNTLLRTFVNAIFNYEQKLHNDDAINSKRDLLNEIFKNKFILKEIENDFKILLKNKDNFLSDYLKEAKPAFKNHEFKDVCFIENNGQLNDSQRKEIFNLIKKEWNRKTKFKKVEFEFRKNKNKKINDNANFDLEEQLQEFKVFDFDQFKKVNENLIKIKDSLNYKKLYDQFIREAVMPMMRNFVKTWNFDEIKITNMKDLLSKNSLIIIYNENNTNLDLSDDLLENNYDFINHNLIENCLPIVQINPSNNFFHSLTSCFFIKKVARVQDLFDKKPELKQESLSDSTVVFEDKIKEDEKPREKEKLFESAVVEEKVTSIENFHEHPDFEEKITFDQTSILDSTIPLVNKNLDEEILFPEIEEEIEIKPEIKKVIEEKIEIKPEIKNVIEEKIEIEKNINEEIFDKRVEEEFAFQQAPIVIDEFEVFDPTVEFINEFNEIEKLDSIKYKPEKNTEIKNKLSSETFELTGENILEIWKEVIPDEAIILAEENGALDGKESVSDEEIDSDANEETKESLTTDLEDFDFVETFISDLEFEQPVEENLENNFSDFKTEIIEVEKNNLEENTNLVDNLVEEETIEKFITEQITEVEFEKNKEDSKKQKSSKLKKSQNRHKKNQNNARIYERNLEVQNEDFSQINDTFIDQTFEMTFDSTISTDITEDFVYLKNNKTLPEVIRWAVYFEYFMDQFQKQKENLEVKTKKYDKNKFKKFEENLRYMNIEETYDFLKENSSMVFDKIYNKQVDSLFVLRIYTLFLHVQNKFEEAQTLITNWKRG